MMAISKRLAALLVALAMTLTGLGVLAQAAPAPQTPEDVFARGNYVKSEMRVQLDPQALSGLLALAGAGADPETEQVMAVITQVLSAVNKLKAVAVSGKDTMSMTAGTELAQIMDMQVTTAEGAGFITSTLLPGLKLTLPQDPQVQQYQDLAQRHQKAFKEMQFDKLAAPYMEALDNYFKQAVAPKATLLPGTVEIAEVGSFDTAMTFDIDTHMMAGLMETMVVTLKQDTAVRQLLDSHLKVGADYAAMMPKDAAASADVASGATPKDSAELIIKLEEGIVKLKGDPAELIARQGVYTNAANAAVYATTEDKDALGLITVAYLPAAQGHELKVSLLARQETPSFTAPDAAATQAPTAPVDWDTVKAGVLAGTDFSTLITLDMKTVPDLASGKQDTNFDMKMFMQGIQIGLQAKGSSALAAPYANKGELSILFMSPTPLMSFFYEDSEVSQAPALPDDSSVQTMELNEAAMAPEGQLMQTLQQKALPALIENMMKALPEESEILLAFIQQLASPSAPTPN